MPRRVAVITSASGAALQDMLAIWRRRFPLLEVIVLDAAVQGDNAEPQILDALQKIPALGVDLAILTRGGGSLEDLWAFNLESVARALAVCPVPTISAIGHEIDTAITDHVADVRAPTPSAAAELCTPHRTELLRTLQGGLFRLESTMHRQLHLRRIQLQLLSARLVSPAAQLTQWMQRADDLAHRAELAIRHRLITARRDLALRQAALLRVHPERRLQHGHEQLARLHERLHARMNARLQIAGSRLGGLARTLEALSPLHTVARGYSILTDPEGRTVTTIDALKVGMQVNARLADGSAALNVATIERKS